MKFLCEFVLLYNNFRMILIYSYETFYAESLSVALILLIFISEFRKR